MNKNEIRETKALNKTPRIITPFLIATAFCLFKIIGVVIDGDKSEGWGILGFMIYLPTALILLALDFIFKVILKGKTLLLWIIEIMLGILGIWYFLKFIVRP